MLSPRRMATRRADPRQLLDQAVLAGLFEHDARNERTRLSGIPVVPPVEAGADNHRLPVMNES